MTEINKPFYLERNEIKGGEIIKYNKFLKKKTKIEKQKERK